MPMRFKIDEDLPRDITTTLRTHGHDAISVLDEVLGGAPDVRVWEAAQRERRCLLTADKGFADVNKYPPGTHGGIILLRLPRESRAGYIQLVEGLLAQFRITAAQGAIVTVSPQAIRIHGRTS